MLLAWAVSCDSYELREDGTANIFAAGFDTFRVESLPAELDLSVVLRFLLAEDEASELEVYVLGPDTSPLGNLAFPIEADSGPEHRPGYLVSQIEAPNLTFLAEQEGVHSVELYADHDPQNPTADEHRRSIFFNVRKGLPE